MGGGQLQKPENKTTCGVPTRYISLEICARDSDPMHGIGIL